MANIIRGRISMFIMEKYGKGQGRREEFPTLRAFHKEVIRMRRVKNQQGYGCYTRLTSADGKIVEEVVGVYPQYEVDTPVYRFVCSSRHPVWRIGVPDRDAEQISPRCEHWFKRGPSWSD